MELCSIEQLKSQNLWLLFLLLALGSFSLFRFLFSFLNWTYVYFLRPPKNLKKYGSWALITGPTDGIGKAFAFQLAQKGLNLVLVGRNPDKLKAVSDTIRANSGQTLIKTVVFDFSGDFLDGIKKIGEIVEDLDIGVLINNVGMCYPYAKYFHEMDEKLVANLIRVNIEGTTKVTQVVLLGMLERKRGAIVNIGSGGSAILPSYPLYSVYAAAKGYVDHFSKSLYMEYKKDGIDVQCQVLRELIRTACDVIGPVGILPAKQLVPMYVATKMASKRKSSLLVPSSNSYARAALRWIGYEPRCTPYWTHSVCWAVINCFPESIADACALRMCLSIRNKGLLKDAR